MDKCKMCNGTERISIQEKDNYVKVICPICVGKDKDYVIVDKTIPIRVDLKKIREEFLAKTK